MVSMLGAATGETASAVFQLSAPYAHCTSFLIVEAVFFIFLGCLLGGLGALWNEISIRLNHFRFVKINHSPWRRALELLILVLIYSTLIIVLPDAVGEEAKCVKADASLMLRSTNGCWAKATTSLQLFSSQKVFTPDEAYNGPQGHLAAAGAGGHRRRLAGGGGGAAAALAGWVPRGELYGVQYDAHACAALALRCPNSSLEHLSEYLPAHAGEDGAPAAYDPSHYCRSFLSDEAAAECSYARSDSPPPKSRSTSAATSSSTGRAPTPTPPRARRLLLGLRRRLRRRLVVVVVVVGAAAGGRRPGRAATSTARWPR